MENKKNIALVLSGGGARGMAHIGVIEYLLENGYNISSISGTSIGSLIAGIYVSGKLPEFKEWMAGINKLDIFKLMDFAISKNGLLKGEKVFSRLKKFLSEKNIEELDIPYAAVAVDIENLKEVVFKSGHLASAIRASVAVPTILKPYMLETRVLVDGGVLNPLPIDCVVRNSNDILIVVDLNADIPFRKPKHTTHSEHHNKTYDKALEFINGKWSDFFKNGKNNHVGYFNLVTQSIYAMQVKLTQIAIEKHKPDVVIQISRKACDMFEFHRSEELIEYGRKQCRKAIGK
jgi:NTE family protein